MNYSLRLDMISTILPELNDIGEQLSKAYKLANAGDPDKTADEQIAQLNLSEEAFETILAAAVRTTMFAVAIGNDIETTLRATAAANLSLGWHIGTRFGNTVETPTQLH